ncbi:MAG: heme-binding protein [Rhodospirillales bacterium]
MLTRKIIAPILAAGLLVVATETSRAEEEALVTFKILSLETALELAQATLEDCRKRGFQTAVSVVDRFGNLQVTLKDRFAGPHTPETARRKAWTAVSFRTSTLEMEKVTQAGKPQSGVRFVTEALMIGGGLPIQAAGSLVGAVGVSGAPGGDNDEACARAGYEAIEDKLAF